MAVHEEFADDLSLYALDALDVQERLAIERHLQECSSCRDEVERLREDLAVLAISATGPTPPLRCRERLIAAIAEEPAAVQIRPRKRIRWLNALEWAGAVAAIVVIIQLASKNNLLQGRLTSLQARIADQEQQLRQARELLTPLTSANAEQFTLAASNTAPQPQGKAIYVPGTGALVFLASNMPAIPSHKTYELWLIPANGSAPIPAGLFKPNAQGTAAILKPPLPTGVEAKTFAVTIEPEAGSSAPTSQPTLVGTRG